MLNDVQCGDLTKIIWHDGIGMSLYSKRLERGRFLWPQAKDGSVVLTAAQLSMLLEGIDWRAPRRSWAPKRRAERRGIVTRGRRGGRAGGADRVNTRLMPDAIDPIQEITELRALLAEREAELAVARAELTGARLRIEQYQAQLAKLRRMQFGRSSEKLDNQIAQLELMMKDLEESEAARTASSGKRAPDHPRRDRRQPVSCETILQAPAPDLPIEKGRPGPGLIANVVVGKYLDGAAVVSAIGDPGARGYRDRARHPGRLGRPCRLVGDAAGRADRSPCSGGSPGSSMPMAMPGSTSCSPAATSPRRAAGHA